MKKQNNFEIKVENNEILFIPKIEGINALAKTEYVEEIWNIVKDKNWTIKKNSQDKPKYLYCNQLQKTLHQVVIDYYFSEELRKKYYSQGFIIEHLNNNGFDCRISNLYFMLSPRNKYKGILFDQQVSELIDKVSIRIFHILENRTFQIIICFNVPLKSQATGKILDALYLLYEYDYDLVFQDAEWLVKYFSTQTAFSLKNFQKYLRFNQGLIQESDDIYDQINQQNPDIHPGSIVEYDGELQIILGRDQSSSAFILETPPLPNWNINES